MATKKPAKKTGQPVDELTGTEQDDAVMGEPTGTCPRCKVSFRNRVCPVCGGAQTDEDN